jgi:hypothetical protein
MAILGYSMSLSPFVQDALRVIANLANCEV